MSKQPVSQTRISWKQASPWAIVSASAVLALALASWSFLGKAPQTSQQKAPQQGLPWNGGKPTPPIQVQSSVEGEVTGGEWVDVTLAIISEVDCQNLVSTLRGVDGLEVSDESAWSHPRCVAGEPNVREVRVKAPAGFQAYLAVDISFESLDGMASGVTRVVPFKGLSAP